MGDGNGSASALAHFASCASLSHVSSLRSSPDMFDTPFLGLCGTKDVRGGNRRQSASAEEIASAAHDLIRPRGLKKARRQPHDLCDSARTGRSPHWYTQKGRASTASSTIA